MTIVAIRFFFSTCLEFLYLNTVCRLLNMRSKRLYCAIHLILFAFRNTFPMFGGPFLQAVELLVMDFMLPVMLSTDARRTAIVRLLLVEFVLALSDMSGSIFFVAITNGQEPFAGDNDANPAPYIATYIIVFIVMLILTNVIVNTCRRFKSNRGEAQLGLSVLIIMLSVFIFYYVNYLRLITLSIQLSYASFAYCLLSLVTIFLVVLTARREIDAQRSLAESAAVLRRTKHTRQEMETMALHANRMSALRHTLANQMRTICSLAECGDALEADRRLAEIQQHARSLQGDKDE